MTDKMKTGRIGENAAARYLQKNGYRIVARNLRLSHMEVDLICENADTLAFVEVKTRTESAATENRFRPTDTINYQKRKHIADAARRYLALHPTKKQPRLDVVEVILAPQLGLFGAVRVREIHHIPNAFDAGGQRL